MADATDMLVAGIRADVRLLLEEGKKGAKAAAVEAMKGADKAAAEAAKKIDQRVEALQGARTRGPAVIAVLSVVFLVLLAYALGWVMGRAGVSVSALLGL